MFVPRTDLVLEAAMLSVKKPNEKIDGVETDISQKDNVKITRVKITNSNGEKRIGKPKGNYITIECSDLRYCDDATKEIVTDIFEEELKNIISPYRQGVVFVAGLGNRFITPDALGPKVSDGINANRHISDDGVRLCTVSPGVLGITGIETGEIIEGVTDRIKPDIIIAIDALAARSMERICTTIQIADTGITPGAGVGNRRKELNFDTMGVPVIAVGVPTVVDAATVANDSVEYILNDVLRDKIKDTSLFDDDNRYSLIKKVLSPYFGELIVTPSQIDSVISNVAKIISEGINRI